MKMLSAEIRKLLDRLYNLCSSGSVILVSMDEEKKTAVDTKERTEKEKSELEEKIEKLTKEVEVLDDEGKRFINALANIKKGDFATVIERLNIDFDPEGIKEKVEKSLPSTVEEVATEKKSSCEELVKVEDEMNEAVTKIAELGIRKDEALKDQDRLKHYIDLALNNNINITREEITTLLAKFDFNETEQREIAKLLMFPEDGLLEYDKAMKGVEVPTPILEEDMSNVAYTKDEDKKSKDDSAFDLYANSDELNIKEEDTIIEDKDMAVIPVVSIPEVDEKGPKTTKEELIDLLTELGFDYLDFTLNDFNKLLENYDPETIRNNIKLINDLKIEKDMFVDNIELMYDTELMSKVERLTSIGKLPQDIYLNPNVLMKYNLNELNSAITTLETSGLEPKSVPLMAY